MRVVWSLLYFFSVLALASPVLVKEQKKVADPLIVPYQQYRLDNGLTVILTQDLQDQKLSEVFPSTLDPVFLGSLQDKVDLAAQQKLIRKPFKVNDWVAPELAAAKL